MISNEKSWSVLKGYPFLSSLMNTHPNIEGIRKITCSILTKTRIRITKRGRGEIKRRKGDR